MISRTAPIGIFDSGIGGLTVAKAIRQKLPDEHIIYFGDTARVPYGIKSMDTVRRYSMEITSFLLRKNVKIIVIACNTAAAAAGEHIKNYCRTIPVLDVIEAGTLAVMKLKNPKKIGVLGTLATVDSGSYEKALQKLDPNMVVVSQPCPMLVPLAEEGWTENEIAEKALEIYLSGFKTNNSLDGLILGCTHYPLFDKTIRKLLNGYNFPVIDSPAAAAELIKDTLKQNKLLNEEGPGEFECYITDKPQRFQELAERFLGNKLNRVEVVGWKH